jgi:hypothetical protein
LTDKITKAHEVTVTHVEHVLYPAHAGRTESPEFIKARHHLVVELDTPCYICGVKHSEGHQIESHHLFAEYSLANAIDINKVEAEHPIFTDNNKLKITSVDSEGNQLALCRFCHRGTEATINHPENIYHTVGIHVETMPIWIAQKYLIEGYKLIADTE